MGESGNVIDAGTSGRLSAPVPEDFHAETAREAVRGFRRASGRPKPLSCDHDPRWVGGSRGWDGPSALRRFLIAVGAAVRLCPPHRPQKHALVESSHRSDKDACLHIHWPETLEDGCRVTEQEQPHGQWDPPHQGRAGGNQPPRRAFPTRPPFPDVGQADRWLWRSHHRIFARQIGSDGGVTVYQETSSLSTRRAGRNVALMEDAPTAACDVLDGFQLLTRLSINTVGRGQMPLERFIPVMRAQARSEERLRLARSAPWRRGECDPTAETVPLAEQGTTAWISPAGKRGRGLCALLATRFPPVFLALLRVLGLSSPWLRLFGSVCFSLSFTRNAARFGKLLGNRTGRVTREEIHADLTWIRPTSW